MPRDPGNALSLVERIAATFLGAGRSPVLPGTVGSAAAVLFTLPVGERMWWWVLAGASVLATILCVRLGRKLGPGGDPGWFVLDEAAGMWLALIHLSPPGWWWLVLQFVLFRVFDMWKPFPLRRLETVGGGLGIVLDDLGAGLYALIFGHGIAAWIVHLTS